jgi:hypothetical protein
MNWTKKQLDQVPEVYRDFMLILEPILDSKEPGRVLKVSGVHLGQIFNSLRLKYDYEPRAVREIADNLKKAGWIEEDEHGFVTPTAAGAGLIRALVRKREAVPSRVPPLPRF